MMPTIALDVGTWLGGFDMYEVLVGVCDGLMIRMVILA
jgi:hypothetical protein